MDPIFNFVRGNTVFTDQLNVSVLEGKVSPLDNDSSSTGRFLT